MGILSSILGPSRAKMQSTIATQQAAIATMIRAKYDAAQTTDLNRRHWALADYYSADAALSPAVRQKMRARARYELANNSYAAGMASTWSHDLVGTGPRLHLDLGPDSDAELVRKIEMAVYDWSVNIDLAKKLRIAKHTKISDGEVFGVQTTNRSLDGVQVDLRLIESDQCVSPTGFPTETDVDGVEFDGDGNPARYWFTRNHPGSLTPGWTLDGTWHDAGKVHHWFHATRPGQHRGVPEIAPALELFAMLRRFTLARDGNRRPGRVGARPDEGRAPDEFLRLVREAASQRDQPVHRHALHRRGHGLVHGQLLVDAGRLPRLSQADQCRAKRHGAGVP